MDGVYEVWHVMFRPDCTGNTPYLTIAPQDSTNIHCLSRQKVAHGHAVIDQHSITGVEVE